MFFLILYYNLFLIWVEINLIEFLVLTIRSTKANATLMVNHMVKVKLNMDRIVIFRVSFKKVYHLKESLCIKMVIFIKEI
jgi:hypothetical protein